MHPITVLLSTLSLAAVTTAAEPVTITLRASAEVAESIVEIGHVADLSGGTASLRNEIARLDLTDINVGGEESIKRRHVEVRLLLSDVERAQYRVVGTNTVRVRHEEAAVDLAGDASITTPIQLAYAARAQMPVEQFIVRLTQPVRDLGENSSQFTVRPFMPTVPRLGDVRLRVGLYLNNRLVKTIPVSANIQQLRPVVTAAAEIKPGEIILASHIQVTHQPQSSATSVVSAEQLIGRTARRRLEQGQRVDVRDVSSTTQAKPDPYLIKTRAVIRIVARKGTLTISADAGGVALRNGRLGDFIPVRNLRSGREITGEVISSTEVQVSF